MQAKQHSTSNLRTPDKVPTPITSVSTTVSSVMEGPSMAIPRAMLCFTSSWLHELRANCASNVAFDKSINSKKKNKASLKNKQNYKLNQLSKFFKSLSIQFFGLCGSGLWVKSLQASSKFAAGSLGDSSVVSMLPT